MNEEQLFIQFATSALNGLVSFERQLNNPATLAFTACEIAEAMLLELRQRRPDLIVPMLVPIQGE